jgi:hypothetical protein
MARTVAEVLHYPRLDTVLMVEDAIKNADDYPAKMQLWKSLPKQVQYQTFQLILDYLEKSNKILIAKDKKIVWIGTNAKLDALLKNSRAL